MTGHKRNEKTVRPARARAEKSPRGIQMPDLTRLCAARAWRDILRAIRSGGEGKQRVQSAHEPRARGLCPCWKKAWWYKSWQDGGGRSLLIRHTRS